MANEIEYRKCKVISSLTIRK